MRDEITKQRVGFASPEECFKVVQKLLRNSKAQFSREHTIAKGRTIEGYRVAAVHAEAVAAEKGKFQDRVCSPSVVIRKFPDSNFTVKDLVGFGSMTCEMGNLLSILPKADVTILVVGPTGSGKTVLVQMVLNNVPSDMRIYAIENPSELSLKRYDTEGRVTNNIVQFEALADSTDEDQRDKTRHTEINLMLQALRMTPHYFVFGEVRANEEFNQAMTAANTGHKFVTTFHAPDDYGAMRRVRDAVIACSPGIPPNTVVEGVCANIDFIFTQVKQWDKSRKVMQMTEVEGVEYSNGLAQPKLRRIFEFRPERKRAGDKKIRGAHWQTNEFSPEMLNRMMSSVMDVTEYDLITIPLRKDENGIPIPRRGHYNTNLLLDMDRVNEAGAGVAVKELLDKAIEEFEDHPERIKNFVPATFFDGTYPDELSIKGFDWLVDEMRRDKDPRLSITNDNDNDELSESELEEEEKMFESYAAQQRNEEDNCVDTKTMFVEGSEVEDSIESVLNQQIVPVGYGPQANAVVVAANLVRDNDGKFDLDKVEEVFGKIEELEELDSKGM